MLFSSLLVAGLLSTSSVQAATCSESRLTIIGTNDIHGSVEPKKFMLGKNPPLPKSLGGMPMLSGIVSSIRKSAQLKSECDGVILVDGGDQFQGTLLSNFSEGQLVFDLMSEAGYDAIVPGNHDYDFGPSGWLVDQLPSGRKGDPREALKKIASHAKFPLLSANTYYSSTIKSATGGSVAIQSDYCKPLTSNSVLDWSGAKRPEFLKPYLIKNVAGIRVGIIGLDHPETAAVTTRANVEDLCFRDPVEEFFAIKKELKSQVDVTLVVMHLGDSQNELKMSEFLTQILAQDANAVDAVIGGHTHYVNDVRVAGVPAIQSGANGEKFGRIDLTYHAGRGEVDRTKTQVYAGKFIFDQECDRGTEAMCTTSGTMSGTTVSYNSIPVRKSAVAQTLISRARSDVSSLAGQVLGTLDAPLTRNRIEENSLGNAVTDATRETYGVDVSILNSGGVRADLPQGSLTYETFYSVLPFNNRAVRMKPMAVSTLVKLFQKSIASCGSYGALNQSGLKVTFERDCTRDVQKTGSDAAARLTRLELLNGEVLFDRARTDLNQSRTVSVVTVDFLAAGGSEYPEFKEAQIDSDLGILREALAEHFRRKTWTPSSTLDGRFQNTAAR